MYYEFNVGDNSYKLKLTTRALIDLEKKIGINPILIYGTNRDNLRVPTVTELVTVIAHSFAPLNHGIKESDVYDIIDAWVSEGHGINELSKVVIEIYKASGLYKQSDEDEEVEEEVKNA